MRTVGEARHIALEQVTHVADGMTGTNAQVSG